MRARIRAVLADQRHTTGQALDLYHRLHAAPELSGAERHTAAALAGWLARDGVEVTGGVGGHGVVGVLRNGPGPLVMLRAELDALPITERTGLPHASRVTGVDAAGQPVGVMHACGHDLHLAALAGAVRVLAAARDLWCGSLLVVGQPAEEILTGARAMLDDGLFSRFGRPDVAIAQHTAPLPAGMVAHGTGPVTAGSRSLEVVIHGRGGHAATAHLGVDPVLAAAATVLRLHTVVSREIAATEPAVLHVGSVRAGTHSGVLPELATLGITLRAFRDDTLDRLAAAVARIVHGECAAAGCDRPPEIRVLAAAPPCVPDPARTAAVRAAHGALLGPARVGGWPPAMASEDFAHFGADGVPLVYWMLGAVGRERWRAAAPDGAPAAARMAALAPHHSAGYLADAPQALPVGIAAMVTAALTHLAGPAQTAGDTAGEPVR